MLTCLVITSYELVGFSQSDECGFLSFISNMDESDYSMICNRDDTKKGKREWGIFIRHYVSMLFPTEFMS